MDINRRPSQQSSEENKPVQLEPLLNLSSEEKGNDSEHDQSESEEKKISSLKFNVDLIPLSSLKPLLIDLENIG